MIARIATRGGPHFVALHRDERAPSRAIWVPVRGDTRIIHLARQLHDRLALIQANAARLLAPPRPDDTVDIDAESDAAE